MAENTRPTYISGTPLTLIDGGGKPVRRRKLVVQGSKFGNSWGQCAPDKLSGNGHQSSRDDSGRIDRGGDDPGQHFQNLH